MNAHRERLNEWFDLQWTRAPAHASIRAILQALDAAQLEQVCREHSQQLLAWGDESARPIAIALDGKVLRGSVDRFEDQKAAQSLSAFCHNNRNRTAIAP